MQKNSEALEQLLTTPIVAEMLNCTARTIRRMVRARHLNPIRIPGMRGHRYRRATIAQFIEDAASRGLPEAA